MISIYYYYYYYTVPLKCDPSVAWLTTSRHDTGVDFSGRHYYSNLKGMCLPPRQTRVIFAHNGSTYKQPSTYPDLQHMKVRCLSPSSPFSAPPPNS